jgi:hypothetical protein
VLPIDELGGAGVAVACSRFLALAGMPIICRRLPRPQWRINLQWEGDSLRLEPGLSGWRATLAAS